MLEVTPFILIMVREYLVNGSVQSFCAQKVAEFFLGKYCLVMFLAGFF